VKVKWFINSSASKHVIRNMGCFKSLNNHNNPTFLKSTKRHAHDVDGQKL
jgi:hypothetical protein